MRGLVTAFIGGILFGAILLLAFTAVAGNPEILVAECHKQLNLGQNGCACVGARAEEVLNEKQQALVVAMVTKDQAASAQARADMTMEEVTGAANFMTRTPQLCAVQ